MASKTTTAPMMSSRRLRWKTVGAGGQAGARRRRPSTSARAPTESSATARGGAGAERLDAEAVRSASHDLVSSRDAEVHHSVALVCQTPVCCLSERCLGL